MLMLNLSALVYFPMKGFYTMPKNSENKSIRIKISHVNRHCLGFFLHFKLDFLYLQVLSLHIM